MTPERLRDVLAYDPETGVFTWRATGKLAGGYAGDGYWRIMVDYKEYRAGRLAWLYMMGRWPVDEAEHRDGDKTNDRWANLREASRRQNLANRKVMGNSRLGVKGVELHHGSYRVRIRVNGKRVLVGTFDTIEAASAAYAAAAREHFGDFARAS